MSKVIKGKKAKKEGKHKKETNVVPFKKNLQVVSYTKNPVSFEEVEKEKINRYGRDLGKSIQEYSKQFRMAPAFFYYHLLFHIKQAAVFNCNYADFKHANDHSTEEIARNQGEMLAEACPELGLEKRKESDTVH